MGYLKRRINEAMEPQEEPPMEVLGWIPVGERLPDEGTWCWVNWDGPGNPFPAMRDSRSAGGWTNGDTWEDFLREVTHWMPLPEPPEVK